METWYVMAPIALWQLWKPSDWTASTSAIITYPYGVQRPLSLKKSANDLGCACVSMQKETSPTTHRSSVPKLAVHIGSIFRDHRHAPDFKIIDSRISEILVKFLGPKMSIDNLHRNNFPLVNAMNLHEQFEPDAKSLWGNLLPSSCGLKYYFWNAIEITWLGV